MVDAEQVLRESCKWLLVLSIRLLSLHGCPYDPPCNHDGEAGDSPREQQPGARHAGSACSAMRGGTSCQIVEVADRILADNWLLVLHAQDDESGAQNVREANGREAGHDQRGARGLQSEGQGTDVTEAGREADDDLECSEEKRDSCGRAGAQVRATCTHACTHAHC